MTDGDTVSATQTPKILQAETDGHMSRFRQLTREYIEWVNEMCIQEYNMSFDTAEVVDRTMAQLDEFNPPEGRLLLAEYESRIAGSAGLRKVGAGVGEIKRMYVRPDHRGKGIGRSLFEECIKAARQNGYLTIRLDTARFMKEAHALYRSAGFHDIEPYAESEIPEEFRRHWVFMELDLG